MLNIRKFQQNGQTRLESASSYWLGWAPWHRQKLQPSVLASHMDSSSSESQLPQCDPVLLLTGRESTSSWSKGLNPRTHMGDPEDAPGFRLVQQTFGEWTNQWKISLCNSAFQINNPFFPLQTERFICKGTREREGESASWEKARRWGAY